MHSSMNNEFACFALLQDGEGVVLIVVLRLDLLILLTVTLCCKCHKNPSMPIFFPMSVYTEKTP